ncbi:CBS domain-containing protein [Thiothrix nivea]|uniref:CBS domain containing protein n=1 Tax=Thiothrix nivea (strain ATCC 35100 / DSM 5205 / JP2) TaxID=870187 RepID=A0A656HJ63_THINJ|nr:CBS domain-containing protein [Thiothrix nivea]EIJ35269.1 CBS domain containing protein [Thiothrix nivea DSM 5205]
MSNIPADTLRARDVMKSAFDVVDGKLTVRQALAQMQHPETSVLVVRKRHADDECGIVLLADIARQVLAKNRSPDRVNIYEIMSKPVLGVPADMALRHCARMFERFGIGHAPVQENGDIVGIISYADMVLHGYR